MRWARHIALISQWRYGAIHALCYTTVPLTRSQWKQCTESGCPEPPTWGALGTAERTQLVDLIDSMPEIEALPPEPPYDFHAENELLLAEVAAAPMFASPDDEALAVSADYLERMMAYDAKLTDLELIDWADRMRELLAERECRLLAGLLEERDTYVLADEAPRITGHSCDGEHGDGLDRRAVCSYIDQSTVDAASDGAVAKATTILRLRDIDLSGGAPLAAAIIDGPTPMTAAASFTPIDLTAILSGGIEEPTPSMLERTGPHGSSYLIYGGTVNGIHGDSGTGKSWLALHLLAERIRLGESVMFIDLEDTATNFSSRLRALGITDTQIGTQVVYLQPRDPFGHMEVDVLQRLVRSRNITVAVVDSLGEAFGLDSVNENNDNEVNPWLRSVVRPLAEAGAAVLLVDHVTKAGENKLHASGSKRKRAAIGGASYLVEAVTPFVRGEGGRLKITCAKDRHGHYRTGEHVAWFEMDVDATTFEMTLRVVQPTTVSTATTKAAALEARVLSWLEAQPAPLSKSKVAAGLAASGVSARRADVMKAIDSLVASGRASEAAGPRHASMVSAATAPPP